MVVVSLRAAVVVAVALVVVVALVVLVACRIHARQEEANKRKLEHHRHHVDGKPHLEAYPGDLYIQLRACDDASFISL